MLQLLQRTKVVGLGFLVGAVLTSWFCAFELPSGMRLLDRLELQGMMFSGPFAVVWFQMRVGDWVVGPPSVSVSGFLAPLLILAHPMKPNWWTAVISVVGIVWWFFAGFVVVVISVWAG